MPGEGVGVIGMCISGAFALAAVDDSVLAPVPIVQRVPLVLVIHQYQVVPTDWHRL
jgi:hypothetical protein